MILYVFICFICSGQMKQGIGKDNSQELPFPPPPKLVSMKTKQGLFNVSYYENVTISTHQLEELLEKWEMDI